MQEIHVFAVGDGLIAVKGGKDGQILEVPAKTADEIKALIEKRQALGRKITQILQDSGIHAASDAETVTSATTVYQE